MGVCFMAASSSSHLCSTSCQHVVLLAESHRATNPTWLCLCERAQLNILCWLRHSAEQAKTAIACMCTYRPMHMEVTQPAAGQR